jgi:translation elongation factor EF-G
MQFYFTQNINNMKLKKEIIEIINTPEHRRIIANSLGVGEIAIVKAIKVNQVNDSLTKAASIVAISNIMNIPLSIAITALFDD